MKIRPAALLSGDVLCTRSGTDYHNDSDSQFKLDSDRFLVISVSNAGSFSRKAFPLFVVHTVC